MPAPLALWAALNALQTDTLLILQFPLVRCVITGNMPPVDLQLAPIALMATPPLEAAIAQSAVRETMLLVVTRAAALAPVELFHLVDPHHALLALVDITLVMAVGPASLALLAPTPPAVPRLAQLAVLATIPQLEPVLALLVRQARHRLLAIPTAHHARQGPTLIAMVPQIA